MEHRCRPFVACMAALVFAWASTSLGTEEETFSDDFELGSPRLDWVHDAACFGGEWGIEGGKLRLTGVLGVVVGTWLEPPFIGDASVQVEGTLTGSGELAALLHAAGPEACSTAYWAGVTLPGSGIWIRRTVGGTTTTIGETSLPETRSPGQDLIIRLDRIGTVLELRVWRPGEDPPAGPTLSATDASLSFGFAALCWEPDGIGTEARFESFEATWHGLPVASFTATPEAGEGPLDVTFDASACSAKDGCSLDRYSWNFGDGQGTETTGPVVSHTFQASGHYVVQLVATDSLKAVSAPATGVVSVACPPGDAGTWLAQDIGPASVAGSVDVQEAQDGSEVHLCAAGSGFSSSGDGIVFVYREVTGDFRIRARVQATSGMGVRSRVGVLLRESLDADSRMAATLLHRTMTTSRVRRAFRLEPGSFDEATVTLPLQGEGWWLRLERSGEEVSASVSASPSPDDDAWEAVGVESLMIPDLSPTLLVGVAAALGPYAESASVQAMQATLAGVEVESLGIPGAFRRADGNADGTVDISDGIFILDYLFQDGDPPSCDDAADANDDGAIDISDAVSIFSFLFSGGATPPAPGPKSCGEDPTPLDATPSGTLDCKAYDRC